MKSMITEKFKSLSLTALLITSATFVACSGDDNITEEQPVQPQVYTMTVDASKGGDAADSRTTRALSLSGSTLSATWATTEHVYVKKGDTWASGSLQPQADGATATLKGTLSGITISADDNLTLQFPKSGDITYTGQTGTLADIAANFDYATASVEVESISASGNINPKAATTEFTNRQAIIKFTLQNSDGSALPCNPTVFTVSDGTSTVALTSIPSATYTTNGNGVLYVAFPAAGESKTVTLTAIAGAKAYSYTKTDVTFTNGQYYDITVKMKEMAGAIPGLFTVSSTGTKVYFSKGNLQYIGSATTPYWKFADNQWDYLSTNGSDATKVDRDLFGWGTSGWNNHNYFYQPYNTSNATSGTYTSSNGYGYGPTNGSKYTYDLTGTYANSDWGVYNAISNGGNTVGVWRTLTKAEWAYLFNHHTVNGRTGEGHSYTLGQSVNGVLGVVLYPDGYTGSTYTTESDWSTFEAAGCVFLPAAGRRNGTSVSSAGSGGYYWSSTAYTTANITGDAYSVYFSSRNLYPEDYYSRYDGYSVRLVRPVE